MCGTHHVHTKIPQGSLAISWHYVYKNIIELIGIYATFIEDFSLMNIMILIEMITKKVLTNAALKRTRKKYRACKLVWAQRSE